MHGNLPAVIDADHFQRLAEHFVVKFAHLGSETQRSRLTFYNPDYWDEMAEYLSSWNDQG
jgi:hypothetical protein